MAEIQKTSSVIRNACVCILVHIRNGAGDKKVIEQVEPRRKIPREEWPAITARHASGESLASIARTYNCTPPAIRYIVRHGRKPESQSENDQSDAVSSPLGIGEHEAGLGDPPTSVFSLPLRSRIIEASAIHPEVDSKKIGFDFSLRDAMTLEVSTFLVAFDAVVAQPSVAAFDQLRAATDRLLRAAARIRIELERMPAATADRTTGPGGSRKQNQ